MSDSPLISPEIRAYMKANDIEGVLTKIINSVAKERPEDCYGYIAALVGGLSTFPPILTKMIAREVLTDMGPTLGVCMEGNIRGSTLVCPPYLLSYDPEGDNLVDEDRYNGRGMAQAADIINSLEIGEFKADQQVQFDEAIRAAGVDKANILTATSFGFTTAAAFFQNMDIYKYVQGLVGFERDTKSRLMIRLFRTGKSVGTRCKFSGWNIFEAEPGKVPDDRVMDVVQTVFETTRRILGAGRGGDSGVKCAPNGVMIAPYEPLQECFKQVNDIITQAGFKPGEDFKIYIECNADDYFAAGKYEMETFKTPIEIGQLAEFYAKLLNDRQEIGYLEDPVATEDLEGWQQLFEKVDPRRVAVSKFYENQYDKLVELIHEEPPPTPSVAPEEEEKKEGEDPEAVPATPEAAEEASAEPTEPPAEEEPVEPEPKPFKLRPGLVVFNAPTTSDLVAASKFLRAEGIGMIVTEAPLESSHPFFWQLGIGLGADFIQIGPPTKINKIDKLASYASVKFPVVEREEPPEEEVKEVVEEKPPTPPPEPAKKSAAARRGKKK